MFLSRDLWLRQPLEVWGALTKRFTTPLLTNFRSSLRHLSRTSWKSERKYFVGSKAWRRVAQRWGLPGHVSNTAVSDTCFHGSSLKGARRPFREPSRGHFVLHAFSKLSRWPLAHLRSLSSFHFPIWRCPDGAGSKLWRTLSNRACCGSSHVRPIAGLRVVASPTRKRLSEPSECAKRPA